jgi:hypothetical protein
MPVHTRLLWGGGMMKAALAKRPNNEGRRSLKNIVVAHVRSMPNRRNPHAADRTCR